MIHRICAAVKEHVEPLAELELKGFGRPVVADEVRRFIESSV
jgi:hypothetical protein